MKKILAILTAIICAASCGMPEDIYTASNVSDILNYKDGTLYNDYGALFTVQTDKTDKSWLTEGNRFFAVFDILDASFNIELKEFTPGTIADVSQAPEDQASVQGDPVEFSQCFIGGGYLNVYFKYSYVKGTDCPHVSKLYYSDNGTDLNLYFVHEGNDENPIKMDADDLKWNKALYCFTLNGLVPSGEYRNVVLDADPLYKDTDGKYITEHVSSPLYSQRIQF